MRAKIVSAFPGTGKTTFFRDSGMLVLDSDSSDFSWKSPNVRNPDFPLNYIDHISKWQMNADFILVSSHIEVRTALREAKLEYCVVYPKIGLKQEYLDRFTKRGSPDHFVEMMNNNWDKFIIGMKEDRTPYHIELVSGEFLNKGLTNYF